MITDNRRGGSKRGYAGFGSFGQDEILSDPFTSDSFNMTAPENLSEAPSSEVQGPPVPASVYNPPAVAASVPWYQSAIGTVSSIASAITPTITQARMAVQTAKGVLTPGTKTGVPAKATSPLIPIAIIAGGAYLLFGRKKRT